jgi:uncharacterized protein YegL
MDKIKEKLLEDFKKANKKRKITLANRYGFSTPEEYLASLEGKEVIKPLVKPTIHNIVLLDNSGSMAGIKFNNAYKGIKEEIEMLKTNKEVDYIYTLFNFTHPSNPNLVINSLPISEVKLPVINANTGTPLYDTLLLIKETIVPNIKEDTKVLLKIFTDGKDEHSSSSVLQAASAIKLMQLAGVTVTFVGTERDVEYIISKLHIDASNTLVHDNTGEGVERAFMTSMAATVEYSKSVVKGEDVSVGFYKKIVK